jgi:signal transduction histidine kinase
VRSSLDNLESEGVREDQQPYLKRAREGALRLGSILGAIGAASRVEESIKQAERINFDLRDLMTSTVAAYRDSFKTHRIELRASAEACPMRGAPDLIVQMLDKLVENAVDFCPPQGRVHFELQRESEGYLLAVDNDGPPIPAHVLEHLFESLFEFRQDRDDKPHFGLGLYIVRLIAEFHQGEARAANRADGGGALFEVRLPYLSHR